ncbi:hypothetical protein [Aestuariivita boseongensis]|uniref:hypothetical protein n=1 Tax=Aestuariivita boseongensis TaxID=1470562 RepID=UPI0006837122|nr:hypothetical protein [Aestuariivita boseongensis]
MGLGDEKNQFKKRLRKLERKNRAMERGFTTQLRSDGLLIVKPKRRSGVISLRSVLFFLAAFILFKGLSLAHVGQVTYDANVAELAGGTFVEQMGAAVMQSDPVSEFVAHHLRTVMK